MNTDSLPPAKSYVPVCAIGASAGGVEALQTLFRQLPEDLGLAYVVILHLAPEHPSAMAEILSACTAMPVHQVNDTPTLLPDRVYVIPPDRALVITGDSVTAREFSQPRGRRAPIDMFFRSVAQARGDGMAVVLTGAGADGSNGLRAVQESGGVIFVQDPAEAEFPSMPRNAIATGVASVIAPLDRLAERIAEVARSHQAMRTLDQEGVAHDLRRIIGLLRARTGHDFSAYKRATVLRRVLRRMQVCRVACMGSYATLIRTNPEEARELFGDLLISVTHFFRDEPGFEALRREVIAPLCDNPPKGGLRIWSAGCATGEEAYSLAILLVEEAERRSLQVPVQIFATDLDEGALATAREGRYPKSIEADLSEERLARFFIDEGPHYRIRTDLRERVRFSSHSVLKDPPFLRLDLICCRNLLIYLERSVQDQLLRLFHYGLRPGGALFLGTAETADCLPSLFAPLHRDARLYRARPQGETRMPSLPQAPLAPPPQDQQGAPQARGRDGTPALMHTAALEQAALPGQTDARRLQADLRAAQAALATSRAEQDAALADLRASNEELHSMNEEYRSTSEDLETSKEELQALNDELQTVNAELKSKLDSTSEAHGDLRNLIAATDIGTLFLDTALRIRMFTPPLTGLFTITDRDIGRSITDFTSRLLYDALDRDARRVLEDLVPLETEVQSRDGTWFIIRLRPYRTVEDRIDGVVLTFVDITARRRMESELRESQKNYQILFDSIDEGFAIIDMIFEADTPVDYRIVGVNAAFARQTRLRDVVGKTARELVPDLEPHWFDYYGRVARSGQAERFEAPSDVLDRYFDVYAFPVGAKGGPRLGVLFRDVSARKDAEAQRQLLTDELSHRVKNTLAVVQALARQPGTADMTVQQFRDRFIGRLQALGHAHDQLLETHWHSADLAVLARQSLSAYGGQGRRKLVIDGPELLLTPKQGLGLALVLHELATNAAKYGSLSVENGQLDVTWCLQPAETGQEVRLVWMESGGPKVTAPVAKGFGSRLIRQACSYELGGSVELLPEPAGFVALIRFPQG
ncbi:chemotaxis protein CheB [Salipiger marinus]|uniref:chemotaxis protein CheB n=1 Tax=Salipiger marinus TaxID=555512 RepID=UPI004059B233